MAQIIVDNGVPFDFADSAFLLIDIVLTAEDGSFIYQTADGITVQIWGSGFTYGDDGLPIGGDPSVITIHDALGNEIASVTLVTADLGDLLANGGADFWQVLFAGDDTIFAHKGDDTLMGYDGDDHLYGDGGADHLFGGQGNDVIDGGTGNDVIDAGADDDTIIFHPGQGNDTIDGGSGFDTVVHQGLNSEWPDIIEVSATGRRDTQVLLEVGSFKNTRQPDEPPQSEATLDNVERLEIYGRKGDDQLHVHDLANTDLADGRIFYDGGLGDDDLNAQGTATDITYLWHFIGNGDPGGGDVHFGAGDGDLFHLLVEDIAAAKDDPMGKGEVADLTITLQAGAAGVDIWEGKSGFGVSPDISLWDAEEIVFDFADGDDSVAIDEDLSAVYAGDIVIDYGAGEGILVVVGHQGDIVATGGDTHNDFTSGDGDDTLTGGAGSDYIAGGGGADTIVGGDGIEDELFGGDGDDVIEGGAGYDEMEGGTGADTFVFQAGFDIDVIFDFEAGPVGGDVLDFTALGITFGDLAISAFNGTDTEIVTPDGDTLYLAGVLPAELDAGDFLF
ncbi:MAG: hypothetical protein H6842_11230 [Rhodospirillaceae bacterium]|nr:hypothetical protein [Rhodospirillaceae bacterium]